MPFRTFDGIYCDACAAGTHLACAERLATEPDEGPRGPGGGQVPNPDTLCACSCDLTCPRLGAGDARLYPANVEPTVQRAREIARAAARGQPKPGQPRPPREP